MKNYFFGILILLIGISAFKAKETDLKDIFTRINQDVLQNGKVYETLGEATSTIGHRLTGSTNGKKAEEYAYNLLKNMDSRIHNISRLWWSRGREIL